MPRGKLELGISILDFGFFRFRREEMSTDGKLCSIDPFDANVEKYHEIFVGDRWWVNEQVVKPSELIIKL